VFDGLWETKAVMTRENAFSPRLEVLPPPQLRLWEELSHVPDAFTLYGGTAIALQLGHRESVDFDFFGEQSFDPEQIQLSIPFLAGARIVQRAEGTLTASVDRNGPILVSFFGTPRMGRLEPPLRAPNNVKVASLIDLAGLKADVVQKRAEKKDYVDIDALITAGIGLSRALSAASIIQGPSFNPEISLKALSYYEEGNLNELESAIRRRLQHAVVSVNLDRLPELPTPIKRFGGPR
jgi:hypothetical protein